MSSPTFDPVWLFNPDAVDCALVVSAEPSYGQPGRFYLRVARGPSFKSLGGGQTFGPYDPDELAVRAEQLVEGFVLKGYGPKGLADLLGQLSHADSRVRARAALRLGKMGCSEAVEPIIAAVSLADDDVCSLLDSLGEIGDPRALPVLRKYSERKLLSRRRSAVEALRRMGDDVGLQAVRQRHLKVLPSAIREALVAAEGSPQDSQRLEKLLEAVNSIKPHMRPRAAEMLYEIGGPSAAEVARLVISDADLFQPNVWRFTKSIFKRSLSRHDFRTFGWIAHAVDSCGQLKGYYGNLKSGYDGVKRHTRVFRRPTQNYVRRLAWRYLMEVAERSPADYPRAATEVLVHYDANDGQLPRRLMGEFGRCYLLNRIIWGQSQRLTYDDKQVVFRFRSALAASKPVSEDREESYPELWDADPSRLFDVLSRAKLEVVHQFALTAIRHSHMGLIRNASTDELAGLLDAPYDQTVNLALAELGRRFDIDVPNWELMARLAAHSHDRVRAIALGWLRMAREIWCSDYERILKLLSIEDGSTRRVVLECLSEPLDSEKARIELARAMLKALGEQVPAGWVQLVENRLAAAMASLVEIGDILSFIDRDDETAQTLGGILLGHHHAALREIGAKGLADLANHELALVRKGAHLAIRSHLTEPGPLLMVALELVESRWGDTRQVAFELLQKIPVFSVLGFDGLVALCDSTWDDVQQEGRRLILKSIDGLDQRQLVTRLSEHPSRRIRHFVVDLLLEHLPAGGDPIEELEPLFRTIMLDVTPRSAVKRSIISVLTERGLETATHANVSARILSDVLGTAVRSDFELIMEGLAKIQLAFPQTQSVARLVEGAQ